ncbi:transcription elongation factor GreA [Burkholderia thailandensis]|nr:transcription elongation factor GreA [Burkholderia thailandensis]NBD02183.1 transcription elongation factor GreA [Burkholderia thailandensis]NOK53479.1 transcription elongation factor GreA [Burkholderia thailandensis]
MIAYPNVPRSIGAVVSRRLATLVELQTVLGQDDLHDLLEIIVVDSHNERVAAEDRRN